MRAILSGLVVVGAVGCHHPIRIVTDDHIRMETPTKVVFDSPPVSDAGRVVPMPLGGCPVDAQEAKIAIVDVDGLLLNTDFTGPYSLGENPLALFREKLDAVAADTSVRAVVLRINSPGGSVTAADIMGRDLQSFRSHTHKPVVACLMDVGAGGAYYLACAADRILAHPTSITGGIGVILNLYNLRDLMAQYNVFYQEIKSGPNIDVGTSAHNLTPEGKQLLQAMADEFHARFRRVVQQARPQVDANDPTTFDGRVFTAPQALSRHLIDRIGYLDDAIQLAGELAQSAGARVVVYHRPNDPAHSAYGVTPNVPLQATAIPLSLPGLDRSRLPTFLYLWQPEATLERLSGK